MIQQVCATSEALTNPQSARRRYSTKLYDGCPAAGEPGTRCTSCHSHSLGKARIALDLDIHFGQVDAAGMGQRLGVDLAAPHHHDLLGGIDGGLLVGQKQRRFEIVTDPHAIVVEAFVPGYHDVEPTRQRPADGGEGLASHDQRLGLGHALEELEVLGQVPGQLVVDADHAVARHGGNHRHRHQGLVFHTATSALIGGWGS